MTRIPTPARLLAALAVSATLVLSGCAGDDLDDDKSGGGGGGDGEKVTIASQDFDEAALVTEMYAQLLGDAGYDVETQLVGQRDIYLNQMPDNIDIASDYLSGIADLVNTQANGADAEPISSNDTQATIDAVTPLLADKGIELLDASPANSQNAYFITEDYAEQLGGATALSDLEGESVTLAANKDCPGRADCQAGLEDVYGITVAKFLGTGFASQQTYDSVLNGESDLGQTGTLDVTLEDRGLLLLEDDKGIQPAQNFIPAVGSDFIADHEDVADMLNELMAALDNEKLGELLVRVTVDRESIEDVAGDFLQEEGLI
ncbi:glycine betaine ABC transporter substrate-binding protein [Nocardioides lijunqiniae]|uniref:glycine betaine ABC transporter substrate-binding protein n=1 Tax=Nocardioides lijunqiniae TaxID=2760832 RepID=UPI001878C6BB|nr:glycine betaine ABC transporter substrate-binding protein [Nocardioides lijunqiniae]